LSGPNTTSSANPACARSAEIRLLRDEIFERLYSGRYYLVQGGSNAGCYFFCDGRSIVCIELCEGLAYRPAPFASEAEAMDAMLRAMTGIRTRVLSQAPYATCRDDDSAHALINVRHVHARLTRWTLWRWFDGLHFHHVWPRRLRRRADA